MKKGSCLACGIITLGLILLGLSGCFQPGENFQPKVFLLEPGSEARGIGLSPLFRWEVALASSPRNEAMFHLLVAPLGQPFGDGISTLLMQSSLPQKLLAGTVYHWRVDLSLPDGRTVRSEERSFSTQDFYTVQVVSNDTLGGRVRVEQGDWNDRLTVPMGLATPTQLFAQPANDFHFDGWFSGEQLLSTDNPFAFLPTHPGAETRRDDSDIVVNARFSANQYEITAFASPSERGQVRIGEGSWGEVARTQAPAGTLLSLEANPVEGYHFAGWYEEPTDDEPAQKQSDENPYVFPLHHSQTLHAAFVADTVLLGVQAVPSERGNVRINDGPWARSHQLELPVGSAVELHALGVDRYTLDGWYENEEKLSEANPFVTTILQSRGIEARFKHVETPFWRGNTRGDPDWGDELPVHKVLFTYDFWVSPLELTNRAYQEFLRDIDVTPDGSFNGHELIDLDFWAYQEFSYNGGNFDLPVGKEDYPVILVTWWGCMEYCNWLSEKQGLAKAYDNKGRFLDGEGNVTTDITRVEGWRLPTEAEWEYMARGGSADIFNGIERNDYKYAGSNTLGDVGWFFDNSQNLTFPIFGVWGSQPVGQKQPNEMGMYDMSGNVWEWCHDLYDVEGYPAEPVFNPIGDPNGSRRMQRGGSWIDDATTPRVSYRINVNPDHSFLTTGFRIAKTRIP